MVLTQAQIEELAVLAELAKPFNGKGLMGCAPCITVGKHAVKYGREASEVVLKRKLSRGKSASKAGSTSGKGDSDVEGAKDKDVEAGGKPAGGDVGDAAAAGAPQDVILITVDETGSGDARTPIKQAA